LNYRISGTIILYNPNLEEVIINILSYLNYIDKLYIIDNTERSNTAEDFSIILNSNLPLNTFDYYAFNNNLGVGKALNLAIEKSVIEGYDFLLTMDQDSFFQAKEASIFFNQFSQIEQKDLVIYSPIHSSNRLSNYKIGRNTYITMTSGNILNVKIAHSLGGFREDFFIDHIDHYFCLLAQKHGFNIFFSEAILDHNLGEMKKLFGRNLTFHSLTRFYYFIRNGLVTRNDFPEFSFFFLKRIYKELLKLCFIEFKGLEAIKLLYKGIADFKNRKMGKYLGSDVIN
jgi:rhamnosyltransferase